MPGFRRCRGLSTPVKVNGFQFGEPDSKRNLLFLNTLSAAVRLSQTTLSLNEKTLVQRGGVLVRHLESCVAAPISRIMSSKDSPQPKKRDSRSNVRRVSSLSAEQLERKRANDRDAQRLIRQRTKEQIERLQHQVSTLEAQVAEMKPRSEVYDELLQQNAALQEEVSQLRHQLASLTGRSSFPGSGEQAGPFRSGWHLDGGPGSAETSIPTTNPMASQFPGSFYPPSNVPQAAPAVSTNRPPHPPGWQQHMHTQTLPLGGAPDPAFAARIESFEMDGHTPQGTRLMASRLPVANPQISFDSHTSSNQQPSESSLPHPQLYARTDDLSVPSQSQLDQSAPHVLRHQRSMPRSIRSVNTSSTPTPPMSAQSFQSSTSSFHDSSAQQSQSETSYPYTWGPQS